MRIDGPRSSQHPPNVADSDLHRGRLSTEAAEIVSWGRLTKEAALSRRRRAPTRKGRPRRRRGYAALPSRGTGHDPAGLPNGGRLRFAPGPPVHRGGPNSVLGPPNQRDGPIAPPAGTHTKGAPTPTLWIRGPAQQRGGRRSSRPPLRWPTNEIGPYRTGGRCVSRDGERGSCHECQPLYVNVGEGGHADVDRGASKGKE